MFLIEIIDFDLFEKKLKNVILTEFSIFRITFSKNKNKDYQNNVDDYENNFGTIYKLVKH